jgi:sugar lactone lactonase YvrE
MLKRLPEQWRPPVAPKLEGPYAVNRALTHAQLLPTLDGVGPEDVAVDAAGRVYAGLEDGRILRWATASSPPEVIARTNGRPLGIEVDPDGALVVCDAYRGLLRVAPERGRVEVLVDSVEGRPLRFANNASIAADGTVYFSQSSTEWGLERYRMDLIEHRAYGRLLAWDPRTRATRVVTEGLYFANGVALAADDSFVLVAETACYRVSRVWLRGPRAGQRDVFVDNLPGFPDNLSRGPSGLFWIAIPNPRDRALDLLLPRPRIRWVVAQLPERLQPQPVRYGLVVGVDEQGRVTRALHDPTGRVAFVTGVREHAGHLWLASLEERHIARVPL